MTDIYNIQNNETFELYSAGLVEKDHSSCKHEMKNKKNLEPAWGCLKY